MPGGCDIFDPFQAQDAHAAIGLTPGDVYWRTREPVQVNGECKYLVAACTPCCDVRGTILGSHEFGGTMLDAAPDADTGDIVLIGHVPRCACTLFWMQGPPSTVVFPCFMRFQVPTDFYYTAFPGADRIHGRLIRRVGTWRDAPLAIVGSGTCAAAPYGLNGRIYFGATRFLSELPPVSIGINWTDRTNPAQLVVRMAMRNPRYAYDHLLWSWHTDVPQDMTVIPPRIWPMELTVPLRPLAIFAAESLTISVATSRTWINQDDAPPGAPYIVSFPNRLWSGFYYWPTIWADILPDHLEFV
jgi:hypothetical protein